ncbi:hypothetical protein DL96DRAFT_1030486 [Flagelloscypha sp. PMI_526]|nr:hypothetical protein DL96DRAFT_1030486 [Flagelloscypha sp. PMI_526]
MNPPLFSLLSRGQGGHKSSKASSAVGSTSSRTGRAYPIINEGYDYLQQTSELLRDNRSALDERLESFSERAARLANAAPRANKLTKGRLRPKEFYDSAQDLLTDVKGAVGPSYKSSSRRRKASSISGTIISNYPETLLSASISDLRPGALAVMDSNRELSRSRSSSGRGHGRGQEAVVPDAKSLYYSRLHPRNTNDLTLCLLGLIVVLRSSRAVRHTPMAMLLTLPMTIHCGRRGQRKT